jgi:hypothetical protein
MTEPEKKLSQDQREYLAPTISKIADAFGELHEKLIDMGWEEGDTSCRRCNCEFFQPQPTSPHGPPSLVCARSTCRHFFTVHRVT